LIIFLGALEGILVMLRAFNKLAGFSDSNNRGGKLAIPTMSSFLFPA